MINEFIESCEYSKSQFTKEGRAIISNFLKGVSVINIMSVTDKEYIQENLFVDGQDTILNFILIATERFKFEYEFILTDIDLMETTRMLLRSELWDETFTVQYLKHLNVLGTGEEQDMLIKFVYLIIICRRELILEGPENE